MGLTAALSTDAGSSGYLVNRLRGETVQAISVLDRLPFSAATRFIYVLGSVASGYAYTMPRCIDSSPGHRTRGFEIALNWPTSFRRALDALCFQQGGEKSKGLVSSYGWVYSELARGLISPEFAPIIWPELRRHAVASGNMAEFEMRLDEECPQTVCVTEIAQAVGRSYATTRRLLEASDLIPSGSRRGVPFAILAANVSLPRQQRTLPAAEVLGISRARARELMATVLRVTDGDRSGRGAELLLMALRQACGNEPAADSSPLPIACRNMSVGLGTACLALLDGRLSATFGPTARAKGLYQIEIQASDLRALRVVGTHMSLLEVARAHSIHPEAARDLARARALGPRDDDGALDRLEVARFFTNFVSAAELARCIDTSPRAVIRRLAGSGVSPEYGPPDCRQAFFDRVSAVSALSTITCR